MGGNAVDAGVAAGLCLNVVHNDMTTLSGVAPIALYIAELGEIITIAGVGTWPGSVTAESFREFYGGIPDGLERCVVPAAAAAWLHVLERYGTMSFEQVSEAARYYAEHGFPVHEFMHNSIEQYIDNYRQNAENARIFLRDDNAPSVGTLIRQPDLLNTLNGMMEAERGAAPSREKGLRAISDYFYRGPVARRMVEFASENGGALTVDDLATFAIREEPPVRFRYGVWEVASCGPWSQGPVLPLALNILQGFDLAGLGHNTASYVNTVASALDLAFADRNAYFGDPSFVDVPLATLLGRKYGELRAREIRDGVAFREPAAPGDLTGSSLQRASAPNREEIEGRVPGEIADTSCVTVSDGHGNLFAATPSDGYCNGPIIPGLGLHISERGAQAFLAESDPNVVQPGKRPRLTPNPVIILREGSPIIAMATPGNDRQVQAMLQVFLNLALFGMAPQPAVEAPRFASYNFRASSWPGNVEPGRLCLEEGFDEAVGITLGEWGRDVRWWPHWCWSAGGVCLSLNHQRSLFVGAADPRRESYAIAF